MKGIEEEDPQEDEDDEENEFYDEDGEDLDVDFGKNEKNGDDEMDIDELNQDGSKGNSNEKG